MRAALIWVMLVPWILTLIVLPILTITYRRFREDVPEIRTQDDLQRLRSLATLQMYLSLIVHPIITIPVTILAWVLGLLVFKELGWLDLLLCGVLPFVVVLFVTMTGNSPAEMAKTIPTSDASLSAERDHIVDVWINRLLPDW